MSKGQKALINLCFMILILLAVFALGEVVGSEDMKSRTYPRTAVVVEIDRPNDTVICMDSVGTLWAFYGVEDWEVGDVVSMILDSRNTCCICDDKVINPRYSSFKLQ